MFDFEVGGLNLTMEPVARKKEGLGGPYLEWIDAKLTVEAQGIQAEGIWSFMPDELRAFVSQLRVMHDACKVGLIAELKSVEPAFSMNLKMIEYGAISGGWRFQPEIDGAYVTGRCGLDQSYLPAAIQGLEEILKFSDKKTDSAP